MDTFEKQLRELEWAHIFHDSIKGLKAVENLPLNVGRMAGNYSFFYVLGRLLRDFSPAQILEFGLGESSKFISTHLEHLTENGAHTIIEQDQSWITHFESRHQLSERSRIIHCETEPILVNGHLCNSYKGLNQHINQKFDLYVIDGPTGCERFSRFQIATLAERFNRGDEFVILIDDYERVGEQDTAQAVVHALNAIGIGFHTGVYAGNKSQLVIATDKYRFAASL